MLYSKIEGSGKPFLILHGFLGMSDNWKTLGLKFSELGYQVHLLDMRNHGRSFHSEVFDYEVMAQDVSEYCRFHQLDSIVLLGHSMGGKIAMQLACKNPDLVEKLIIADIGPKYYPPHHQQILAALNAVDFSLKPSRQEVDNILSRYINDFGTKQFLLKSLYWKEPGQLAFRFNLEVFNKKIENIGQGLPTTLHFARPCLFVRGSVSNYILDSDVERIKEQFPLMQLKTIEGAGHWLHAENPELFYDFVFEYLKK
ncbi:alpha/beta fold hydrolase [Flavobacterium sp. NRK F10]|uniref:alpha/beta fold hydrolase n=1 Tax=Flavobacterium sp. NRK F10 TaxID=2954931 RepID=UPI002091A4D7|nr:alpha/beta fold hydrolase [Flavobacterium sp. NRK F10]MCO6175188.1 alpha/beta fold hydrolase [Flavobacterium sp. NRK F10]